MSPPTANPFSIEAVATYGQVIRTCKSLGYIERATAELNQYLQDYPVSTKRYGAAIGFKGGHGSGKTHLLMWLSQLAAAVTTLSPIILYAKADRAAFFDLYAQLLGGLPRERLLQIIGEALRNLARKDASNAKMTESLVSRIKTAEDLNILAKEENLDLDELSRRLEAALEDPNTQIPSEIPRAVMKLTDPIHGEKVYQWLFGKSVAGLEDLKLDHPLLRARSGTEENSEPDVTAVNALETIAALSRLAGRPLIVLIDQMEVLFRADETRRQVMFSVLKKLIEQLNSQNTMTFIAGNEEAWKAVPPDVPPRLRLREPLRVGNLDVDETRLLLEAYLDDFPFFSKEAIQRIHNLSGGNPREIIRLAYYAYEESGGEPSAVTAEALIKSANESGSVATRARRALEIADDVFGTVDRTAGAVLKDLAISNGVVLNRVLQLNNKPVLALIVVQATDKISEIDSARRVNSVRQYIETTWGETPLIVVPVGYSSDEIQSLLGPTATFVVFREITFANELKTRAAELIGKQSALHRERAPHDDPPVLEVLNQIALRLDKLEKERGDETNRVVESFAKKTEALQAPAQAERQLQTRWELLAVLDQLEQSLRKGEVQMEQGLMKSLLVANEVHLRVKQIDYLGGLYLDILSDLFYAQQESGKQRLEIIKAIRRLLRDQSFVDRWLEAPLRRSLIAAIAFSLVTFFIWPGGLPRLTRMNPDFRFEFILISLLPNTLIFIAGLFLLLWIAALTVSWLRRRRWERLARSISG